MSDGGMRVRLVVFDWAGTTVDHGCFAPVEPFIQALGRHRVTATIAQARAPMGLSKLDHLKAMLADADIARQWHAAHGRASTDDDAARIYADDFVPLQIACVEASSGLIDGVLTCVEELRARGIRIGTSTGYFAEAAERCYAAAAKQGYVPDRNVHPGEVATGRPAPWMIYRNMEALGVYPSAAVVKIGDTTPDILEGLNAGVWSVGVAATGSDVGLTADELAALPRADRDARVAAAGATLSRAGAHYVIDSVRDLPALVTAIDERLRTGELPSAG